MCCARPWRSESVCLTMPWMSSKSDGWRNRRQPSNGRQPAGSRAEGSVMLGNFPATAQVSPDGEYVYVVNFNLHGEMVPSSVSRTTEPATVRTARHGAARC